MPRLSKILFGFVLIVFMLACNLVSQPIKDAQNLAGTAESIASSMPVETLQAFATNLPVETLQAIATNLPVETLQAVSSEIPDFEKLFDPQGEPVDKWNDIPVMPQATAGMEATDAKTYSFKVDATPQEVQDYYNAQLPDLGWSQTFSMPGASDGSVNVYSKDNNILTVTVVVSDGNTIVLLTLA